MYYYVPALLVTFFQAIPAWTWMTALITIVHTIEETTDEIWDELPIKTPPQAYFAFQTFIFILGLFALFNPIVGGIFIGFRFFDIGVTHGILTLYNPRIPGFYSAPLLFVDSFVIFWFVTGIYYV